jgi:hypothetical protein
MMDLFGLFVLFSACVLVPKLLYPFPIQWEDDNPSPNRNAPTMRTGTFPSVTSGGEG